MEEVWDELQKMNGILSARKARSRNCTTSVLRIRHGMMLTPLKLCTSWNVSVLLWVSKIVGLTRHCCTHVFSFRCLTNTITMCGPCASRKKSRDDIIQPIGLQHTTLRQQKGASSGGHAFCAGEMRSRNTPRRDRGGRGGGGGHVTGRG